jgi:histidine ammonia-lyase
MNSRDNDRRRIPQPDAPLVVLGPKPLGIADVVRVAHGGARALLDESSDYREFLARGMESLKRQLDDGGALYGITTGVGASVGNRVPRELVVELPINLIRMHGCGTGRPFSEVETAAIVVARLASLARGYSAVRPVLQERLCELLNRGMLPVALICNPGSNNGLPADLVALDAPESRVHHGVKAMQITASALAAEALRIPCRLLRFRAAPSRTTRTK